MSRFYKKLILFLILFGLLCLAAEYVSMKESWDMVMAKYTNSEEYISVNVGPAEIIPDIEKVRENDDTTTLIIGDSVCGQMFDLFQEYNEDICMAASNAAVSMTGQYILAREYIENHPKATDIYLFVLPSSLQVTLNTKWGYQYMVMPFVKTDTLKMLENETIKEMEDIYGSFFMKPFIVEMIDQSAINRKLYLNMMAKIKEDYKPQQNFELADNYIKKLYDLCKENNIQLHVYPGPVSEEKKTAIDSMKAEYKKTWLSSRFPAYLEDIMFFPKEQSADGVHFSGEYASLEHYEQKIRLIFKDTKLLDTFDFE